LSHFLKSFQPMGQKCLLNVYNYKQIKKSVAIPF